jgi:riboflavin kinase/FMN adenylyltransferase
MRTFEGVESFDRDALRRPALTLGVFDGVHRGHLEIFAALRRLADSIGGPAVVVTFRNHPEMVLRGEDPPFLTSLEHRLVLFERAEMDAAVLLRFDERLARLEPEPFVRDVLVGRLGARGVVLGYDQRFGRARRGGLETLQALAPELGLEVRSVSGVQHAGEPVSSTRIRAAIGAGALRDAEAMLGRPVSVLGTVVRGDGRGRRLGFPTANLDLHQEVVPPRGVYATRALLDGVTHDSLTNIGLRPTFHGGGAGGETVETHLLGFPDRDLYGGTMEVFFLGKLRDERKFDSIDALVRQIGADRDEAHERFFRT